MDLLGKIAGWTVAVLLIGAIVVDDPSYATLWVALAIAVLPIYVGCAYVWLRFVDGRGG